MRCYILVIALGRWTIAPSGVGGCGHGWRRMGVVDDVALD